MALSHSLNRNVIDESDSDLSVSQKSESSSDHGEPNDESYAESYDSSYERFVVRSSPNNLF